jgi:hypothetical protein
VLLTTTQAGLARNSVPFLPEHALIQATNTADPFVACGCRAKLCTSGPLATAFCLGYTDFGLPPGNVDIALADGTICLIDTECRGNAVSVSCTVLRAVLYNVQHALRLMQHCHLLFGENSAPALFLRISSSLMPPQVLRDIARVD